MADSSSKVVRHITIDEMLTYVGEFDLFQWLLEILFCLLLIPQTYPLLVMYFAALNPTWKCVENSTYCNFNGTFSSDNNARCSLSRESWMYTEPDDFSIVTQFDIYCDREWQIHLTTSIFFASWGIGAVVMGWLADNYGRRTVIFPSSAVVLIIGFLSSFSPNVYWFIVGRAIVGFFTPGAMVQEFIILSEIVGGHDRPKAGIIFWLIATCALLALGLQAYFIRQWKTLFMVLSAPYIFLLAFYKFVPESVRWLRLHGKTDEVMEIFNRIASWNKKDVPSDVIITKPVDNKETQHQSNPLDLFKTKRLAIETLIQGYVWLVNAMVFFGLSLASSDLGGSLYRNYILLALIEFPAGFAAIYLCEKFGRKKTIVLSMLFGSIACISLGCVPSTENNIPAKICLGMIGKFFMTLSFDSIYTWSVEIYPTSLRAEGMGFLQVTSRVGAASSPWIAKSLRVLHESVPFIVMGLLALIGCGLAIFLPETKGVATAETANDVSPKENVEMENVTFEQEK